jgi:putative N6-adenine-specific DNA methylase
MFEYQKFNRYFAQVAGKMEEICAEELTALGATKTQVGYRGVYFEADKASLYRINYESRMITRVLAQILTFNCHSAKYLIQTAQKIEWEKFLRMDQTFAINATIANSDGFTHSLYTALCLKDGIADYFTAKFGKRPNVDTDNPDVRFNLRIDTNRAVISIDTSGDSLHKRGYRKASVLAPMQETLAGGIVHLTEWDGETTLWDPMCGSGTLLTEALMSYCKIPAQYLRKQFGFFNLPDFDNEVWKEVKLKADSQIRELPEGILKGSDMSEKAIRVTRKNLESFPKVKPENVELFVSAFQDAGAYENGTMVVNPPYGVRLSTPEEACETYKELGDYIKKNCNGSSAYVYAGEMSLRKCIGLKPSKRWPMVNGKLEGQLMRIDSYRVDFRQKDGPKKES